MHVADELAHLLEGSVWRLMTTVYAIAEDVELVVGDQYCDLDEGVVDQIKTSHLAVDPDQQFAHGHTLWFLTQVIMVDWPPAEPPAVGDGGAAARTVVPT